MSESYLNSLTARVIWNMGNHRKAVNYFQLDSGAGVPAWSPAVQLQEQVGEGEVDLEVETCLPLLSNHPGLLQGWLTKDKYLLFFCFFSSGYPVATSESSNGWDEHQGDGL